MDSPFAPPQDVHQLDRLTQLAVKLRTERESVRWPHWSDSYFIIFGVVFGVILWRMEMPGGSFVAYIGAVIVMLGFHAESERRVNKRIERLEEVLTQLSEEIAKRQRAADNQLVSFRPPSG